MKSITRSTGTVAPLLLLLWLLQHGANLHGVSANLQRPLPAAAVAGGVASPTPTAAKGGRRDVLDHHRHLASVINRGGGAGDSTSAALSTSPHEHVAPPLLMRPWIRLYRTVPKIHVPGTNLDVAFTVASAIVLTCVDYGSAALLYASGWPAKSKHTRAVAGSIATIFHSTVLVLGLGAALSTQRYDPSGRMEDHPDWWQEGSHALIQFCTGYMMYDALVQFVADRWQEGVGPVLSASDWMFMGHHFATSLYMVSARLCEAGHMSAMILMFTGEFTAPIMNVLRISRTASNEMTGDCCGRTWLPHIQPYVEYIFALLYAGFRIIVGPICAAHLTYDILLTKKGRKNVPVALSSVWLFMVWAVLFGSIPWIKGALAILKGGLNTGGDSPISSIDPN